MTSELASITAKRDEWMEATLDWVGTSLQNNPPGSGDQAVRKEALLAMDDVLHVIEAPHLPVVQRFFRRRMESAVHEIENTDVSTGAVIWKLYDHCFIVSTSNHTLSFDFYRGVHEMVVGSDVIQRIAAFVDAHFISHDHEDHMDLDLVTQLLQQEKPVVMPQTVAQVWAEHELMARAHQVRDGCVEVGDLTVSVFPGHQGERDNNWYLMTSDGVTIVHTGDQDQVDDFTWIDKLWRDHQTDILLVNCWTQDIPRLIDGVCPKHVITGHENELGHSVDHRESYEKTYNHLQDVSTPYSVMTWGESLEYLI